MFKLALLTFLIVVLTGCGLMIDGMIRQGMTQQERCFDDCATVYHAVRNACDYAPDDAKREQCLKDCEREFKECRGKCAEGME